MITTATVVTATTITTDHSCTSLPRFFRDREGCLRNLSSESFPRLDACWMGGCPGVGGEGGWARTCSLGGVAFRKVQGLPH